MLIPNWGKWIQNWESGFSASLIIFITSMFLFLWFTKSTSSLKWLRKFSLSHHFHYKHVFFSLVYQVNMLSEVAKKNIGENLKPMVFIVLIHSRGINAAVEMPLLTFWIFFLRLTKRIPVCFLSWLTLLIPSSHEFSWVISMLFWHWSMNNYDKRKLTFHEIKILKILVRYTLITYYSLLGVKNLKRVLRIWDQNKGNESCRNWCST